jgi:hypothetical protein
MKSPAWFSHALDNLGYVVIQCLIFSYPGGITDSWSAGGFSNGTCMVVHMQKHFF